MATKDYKFIVYRAENTINGKQYVGYTSRGLAWRRNQHIRKAMRNESGAPRLCAAIRKYGEESFIWEILATFDSADEALSFEVLTIRNDKPAYNVSAGGRGLSAPAKNRLSVLCLSDGSRYVSLHAAAKHYGSYRPERIRAVDFVYRSEGRYFLNLTGEIDSAACQEIIALCVKKEAEQRRKVDQVSVSPPITNGVDRLGRSSAGPAKNARPVICLDDDSVFPSASAAAFHYKISKSAIIELCLKKNGRVSASGKRFEYVKVN